MKTNKRGLDLIAQYEGCRLKAYKCVPTEQFYTIGFGHYGADVTPTMTISMTQAKELLAQDLARFEKYVNDILPHYPTMNENQFSALVSFTYNCGVGNLRNLTNNNTKPLEKIADSMLSYVKSGGVVLNGLVKRRKAERELFMTPIDGKTVKTNEELAQEVLNGLWGNGYERKLRLTKAGYNYNTVQDEVNKILKG